MPRRRMFPVSLVLALLAVPAAARIVSYASLTANRIFPAVQHRMNRYFVVVEAPALASQGDAQLVRYDSTGMEEPKVIHPKTAQSTAYHVAAVREDANHVSTILILSADAQGSKWQFSADSGETWKTIRNFGTARDLEAFFADRGGPFARERESLVRIGSADVPFYLSAAGTTYAIDRNGSETPIAAGRAIGTNRAGTQVVIRNNTALTVCEGTQQIRTVTASGDLRSGWLTDRGDIFASEPNGTFNYVPVSGTPIRMGTRFAIPTFDYSGAWIVIGGSTSPASLFHFDSETGSYVRQWDDATNPEIEALHAGTSGNTLLIQVHRPRPLIDQAQRVDPALAIWRAGDPAPREYDELYLAETATKGFVHLDVDAVANGAPFVFDSGSINSGPTPGFSAGGGGGDLVQEWGLVRASLRQTLVLPGIARTPGALGTFWLTDVVFHNGNSAPNAVRIRYVPTYSSAADERVITLGAREIRYVPDVLKAIFGYESGGGVFYLEPESAIDVTSRTYTRAANGTYGFGMPAYDIFAAATARFPVTFSGAFPGSNFRTNLTVTDASGTGSASTHGSVALSSEFTTNSVAYETPRGGQTQLNNIGRGLGLAGTDPGALSIAPARGSAIASVFAIDNSTNDPTWFPPDIVTTVARSIPAVGHLDGANGSRFRSDLYLYNPTSRVASIWIEAHPWETNRGTTAAQLSMLPHESRVIRDVLQRVFGMTGIARLRMTSPAGIRYSARTYTIDANGGTYGALMPPLNAFQIASSGETLEILGAVIDGRFRTNIGIVELSNFQGLPAAAVEVQILESGGTVLDRFAVTIPSDTGVQINDVFRARAIAGEGKPVIIRIESKNRVIGAYVTMNDNGTNDSFLLSAQFAARP